MIEAPKLVEKLMQKANDKPDVRVINIAEKTVADAFETCDVDHNNALVNGTLRSTLEAVLVFILNNSLKSRKSFQDSII